MKLVLFASVLAVCFSQAASAQRFTSEIEDGRRYMTFGQYVGEDGQPDPQAAIITERAIALGLFDWQLPTKQIDGGIDRPVQVAACKGHDERYRPAHKFGAITDRLVREPALAATFIYEWTRYRDAILANDCTCASLVGDYDLALSQVEGLTKDISYTDLYSATTIGPRDAIKRDYDRMCDITMSLQLE